MSELARRHVTVVLSGDGGDELFAGYDRYVPHPRVAQFDTLPMPGKRTLAGLAARTLPHGARGQALSRHVARDEDDRYIESVSFFGPEDRRALARSLLSAAPAARRPKIGLRARFARVRHLPLVSRMMHADFGTYLPEDVLTKVDRMSMAHSIESRVPLLDHPLVEFACACRSRSSCATAAANTCCKRVAARLLPDAVLRADASRASGCRSVSGSGARLRDAFQDVLLSSRAQHAGISARAKSGDCSTST